MTMQETSYTGAQLAALTAGAHECRAPAPNIPDDLQRLQARLADLTSSAPRWERLVRAAAGAAVLDDVGWPGLADACPAAAPPRTTSIADINGTATTVTSQTRQHAELARSRPGPNISQQA